MPARILTQTFAYKIHAAFLLAVLTWTVLTQVAVPVTRADAFITVASTTSTENSGLFAHILPRFQEVTSIQVRVVAMGTGQAIRIAQSGDADVLFVHHKPSELRFVSEGYGIDRREVMYNDFVIVGPKTDPASIGAAGDAGDAAPASAATALAAIALSGAIFVSRGDDSGTHRTELELWRAAGIDPTTASGRWYRETGSGMGASLNIAAAMDAYALTDRGTWISFKNKRDLIVLVEGDPALFNQYGVILVNPRRFPHVKAEAARAFIDWLTSPDGQQAIDAYSLDGQQLFFANAGHAPDG